MKTGKQILLPLLLGIAAVCFAQQPDGGIELDGRPAHELFDRIEASGRYRIFYTDAAVDSLPVTVRGADPFDLLQQAFRNTEYRVSRFQDDFFILENRNLVTALLSAAPEQRPPETAPAIEPASGSGLTAEPVSGDSPASAPVPESKIYEIGDPAGPLQPRVTLSGYITDVKTALPVAGAAVYTTGSAAGVTTDNAGFYLIRLPAGRQELFVHSIGVKDTGRQLMLYSDGKLNIEVEEEVRSLDEVVVNASRTDNIRTTMLGVERLFIRDIKNIPTVFGESDILRVVMALPGVKSVGEVSSGYNVRGGATDQNLILFNDGTIYNPTHLFGVFSAFNPDVVQDMDFYKSSIPAKYGGRISSVLDIRSREGNREKLRGSASIGLLTSRLSLEGPLFSGKTSFLLGGRTTYSNWLLKQIPEGSGGYNNGKGGFLDLNASLAHHFSDRSHLYADGYFSRDYFAFNTYENYAYRNANASAKWRYFFTPGFTGTLTGGYDHYDYRMENTEDTIAAYRLDFRMDQLFAKLDFTASPRENHHLNFGLSAVRYDFHPGNRLPGLAGSLMIEDRLPREKALEPAVYLGDEWDVTSRLSLNAGIRYSMFNVLGPRTYRTYDPDQLPGEETVLSTVESGKGVIKTYRGPEYRFSARYAFSDGMSVKAGVNTMRQYIHKVSNTSIMSPTDIWKLSDMHILPQNGMQVAAGLFRNFAGFETSVELYYKTMNNYMDYRPGAELMMNHHLETDVVSTEGLSYGMEWMLKKTQGKLNGWVSYTFSRTLLRQSDPRTVYPVNGGHRYPADFDKPHEFKFAGNYKFTQRYSVSLNCDYSTGRPVTLPVAKYRHAGGQYVYYTERNLLRVPDFFRIDLSFNVEPSHHLTRLLHSSFTFGVYNLTGRDNAYSIYYVSDRGVVKGYKLAIFGVPLPYVSYNVKF
ncbi:MAG: TonB-dependent receptor [Tannerella sp.]|jgi:hypothetical protein|nr:TonB-dependent receptor [Tannerella sp.]